MQLPEYYNITRTGSLILKTANQRNNNVEEHIGKDAINNAISSFIADNLNAILSRIPSTALEEKKKEVEKRKKKIELELKHFTTLIEQIS